MEAAWKMIADYAVNVPEPLRRNEAHICLVNALKKIIMNGSKGVTGTTTIPSGNAKGATVSASDTPPVIKALREASATPMAVWADLTGAGSTRDAELWEEGRSTPSPQSCERMWAHWHAWVRTNAPLLDIPETSVETAIAKPPLLLPADTLARTLTQYALMLHGQRFTIAPTAGM